jgi:hypothetical protein
MQAMVSLSTADDLFDLNRIMSNSKYRDLSFDVGAPNNHFLVDGKSIRGLAVIAAKRLFINIIGPEQDTESFLSDISKYRIKAEP